MQLLWLWACDMGWLEVERIDASFWCFYEEYTMDIRPIFTILYIFYISCRVDLCEYPFIGSCWQECLRYINDFTTRSDEIFPWIGLDDCLIPTCDEIKKMTGLYTKASRIGDRIDRQRDDTHKGKWPRTSNTPDSIDMVFIDNIDKKFWKC